MKPSVSNDSALNLVSVSQMWRLVVKFWRRILSNLLICLLCLYFSLLCLFHRYSTLVVCMNRYKCLCQSSSTMTTCQVLNKLHNSILSHNAMRVRNKSAQKKKLLFGPKTFLVQTTAHKFAQPFLLSIPTKATSNLISNLKYCYLHPRIHQCTRSKTNRTHMTASSNINSGVAQIQKMPGL